MKEIIAIIPVRAGSKGLPSKNTREFCGLPLFYRAAEQGLIFADRCIITTDIKSILENDLPLPDGVELQSRPAELSTDDTPMSSVILDALSKTRSSGVTVLLLQATSPLRSSQDIKASLDLFDSSEFPIVFTVSRSNPSVLKNGFLVDGKFSAISDSEFLFQNRQLLPQTYKPNGAVYVFDGDWFVERNGFNFETAGAIEMPEERSFDIDSLSDFLKAESAFKSIDEVF